MIYRYPARPLTLLFLRLKVSPNAISIGAIALSLSGLVLLVSGHGIWGISAFIMSYILDRCDGEVARGNKRESVLGLYLETLQSNVFYSSFFMGLGAYVYWQTNSAVALWLGATIAIFKLISRHADSTKGRLRQLHKVMENSRSIFGEESKFNLKREAFFFIIQSGGMNILALVCVLLGFAPYLLLFYTFALPILTILGIVISARELGEVILKGSKG